MKLKSLLFAMTVAGVSPLATSQTATVNIDVAHPAHKMGRLFYGLMTEEINHSYEGGLYAELVQNRSFRDSQSEALHWAAQGATQIALDRSNPGKPFLHVDIAKGGGVANDGYWGVPVKPHTTYRFVVEGRTRNGVGNLQLKLSDSRGKILGSTRLQGLTGAWKIIEGTFRTEGGNEIGDGKLIVAGSPGAQFDLRYVSLFPPTFRNHMNGNRADLIETLAAMKPSFLRLPGGNYLEGNGLKDYYPWKSTLTEPWNRPGHAGCWGYHSNDGMGLYEYLQWCEELNIEPVLAVYAGYALNGQHIEPGRDLEPYVREALEEIEFVTGSPETPYGALRAKMGHRKPFPLTYVEVGNEDGFDPSGSYEARFRQFYDAIKAKYPHLQLICTAQIKGKTDVQDDHYYRSASAMAADEHHYDLTDRNGPKIFVGEWASTEGGPTPIHNAALGDAAWMIGLERNSDVVVMESYAPLFVNVNPGAAQWGTNLIGFDNRRVVKSPSYWVQALYGQYSGDEVLPLEIAAADPVATANPLEGKVGLMTYRTQAEFKDMVVTAGDRVVYTSALGDTHNGWTDISGQWSSDGAVLRQSSLDGDVRTYVGDSLKGDYSIKVKARKIGGAEGFFVLFGLKSDSQLCQWNLGGWNNTRSAIQVFGDSDQTVGNTDNTIETGRWYDVEVDVRGDTVTCSLDGKLITKTVIRPLQVHPVHFGALKDSKTGDILLRAVNVTDAEVATEFNLQGVSIPPQSASAECLKGRPEDQNTLTNPDKVRPVAEKWDIASAHFVHKLAPHSVYVVRIKQSR